jgi:two-component system, LytTR family, sensor histidine kinase AlgZ
MKEALKLLIISMAISVVSGVAVFAFSSRVTIERLVWVMIVSTTYSLFIGGLSWYLLPRLAPRFHRNTFLRWVQLFLLLSAISLTGGTAAFAIFRLIPIRMGYYESMVSCLVFTWLIGAISYIVENARARLHASTLELRTKELAITDARLRSLESRIHPHFLFNTLNSISSLVRTNPDQAEETIERLAALLRFSLDRNGSLVTLEDELKITRDYLEIERTRFQTRLRYSIDCPPSLGQLKVPALSIQTLVENSVKYAVGAQRAGADILIRVSSDGHAVEVEVEDTGPGFSPHSLPAGHGLDSLKARLEVLFGDRARLRMNRLDTGMEVGFRIPC